jgi:OTU-like cysteine protease
MSASNDKDENDSPFVYYISASELDDFYRSLPDKESMSKSTVNGKSPAVKKSFASSSESCDESSESVKLKSKFEVFARYIESRGLRMTAVAPDGNCLFRSVALQVYGDVGAHVILRQRCMDFMASSRNEYEPFVGDVGFERYIAAKRRDGCESRQAWGGHLEVQAMSEMFSTPIEIYNVDSGEPVNIFHQGYRSDDVPVRLSYHNGNHYNALVAVDAQLRRNPVPADVEQGVVTNVAELSARQQVEDSIVRDVAEQSASQHERSTTQHAIDESIAQATIDSLAAEEAERIRLASLADADADYNRLMQETLAESRRQQAAALRPQPMTDDPLYAALQASLAQLNNDGGTIAAVDDDDDDDNTLQRILAESLSKR